MKKLNLGFVSSVKLGLSCIKAIYEIGYKLSLVVTLSDNIAKKKSGRVFFDDFCKEKNINLIKTSHINDQKVIDEIKKKKIDWLFIIGWSQIASLQVLSSPRFGAIGAHPTLLPIGRGRASIPWAIIKRLDKTGVTLFKINEKVDAGPILAQKIIKIEDFETASTLYRKVELAHVKIIKNFIPTLLNNNFTITSQDEKQATIWPGRKPEDGIIDTSSSVWHAERLVRALTKPYPGAFLIKNNKKIIIWKASVSSKKLLKKKCLKFTDGYLILDEFDIVKINDF